MKHVNRNAWTAAIGIIATINLFLFAYFLMDVTERLLHHRSVKPAYTTERTDAPVSDFGDSESGENLSRYDVFLEWHLVHVERSGNFIVETYQEFEVYKDGKETVKTVATPHYQYLRYWDEEKRP